MARLGMPLKQVKVGYWLLTGNGEIARLSNNPRCPECGTPNWCIVHKYAYLEWWVGMVRGLGAEEDVENQLVSVFRTREDAVAARG